MNYDAQVAAVHHGEWVHRQSEIPVLLIGRLRGSFRVGWHWFSGSVPDVFGWERYHAWPVHHSSTPVRTYLHHRGWSFWATHYGFWEFFDRFFHSRRSFISRLDVLGDVVLIRHNFKGSSALAIVVAYFFAAIFWALAMAVMVGVPTAVIVLILKLFGVV